jgi:hypothetical protein
MRADIRHHLWYYIVTVAIFSLGLVLIALNEQNSSLQALLIAMTATCYFTWSLLHHYIHHELHLWVVIEYILIALLGVVLSLYLFSI